jgi:hypothetical protein
MENTITANDVELQLLTAVLEWWEANLTNILIMFYAVCQFYTYS